MTVSPVGQGKVFVLNILFGMLCVLLFDFFWILRKKWGKSSVAINTLDGIYFVLAFLIILFAGVKFNFGALRYYQIMGLAIGIGIQKCFSSFVKNMLEKTYDLSVKISAFTVKIIVTPGILILRVVLSLLCFGEEKVMNLSSKLNKKYKKFKLKRMKKKKTVKKRMKMI